MKAAGGQANRFNEGSSVLADKEKRLPNSLLHKGQSFEGETGVDSSREQAGVKAEINVIKKGKDKNRTVPKG